MSDYGSQGAGYGEQREWQAVPPPLTPPPPAPVPYTMYAPPPSNGIGVGGFVTGLLGLLLLWVPAIGMVLAIVGLSLSGTGISQGNRRGAPTGLAVAGLVLAIIAVIPATVITVAVVSSS